MISRLSLLAVLVCALTGWGQAPTKKEARGKEMEVLFNDGKKLRMYWLDEKIELTTTEGKATIPVRDIHLLRLGAHVPPGGDKKIQAALKALGSDSFKEREQAKAEPIGFGRCVLPKLAEVKGNLEAIRRAEVIKQRIEEKLPETVKGLPSTDQVTAIRTTLDGRLVVPALKFEREYFGSMEVPLHQLASLSSPFYLATRTTRYVEFPEIARLIGEKVEMKGFLAPDPGIRFKDVLELLYEYFEKRGKDFPILVDIEAFKTEVAENDADKIYNEPIKFQPFPKKMTAGQVLRYALDKLPSNATYLIRNGTIEVTTAKKASPQTLLKFPVAAFFHERCLDDAVNELAEFSGATIVLDSRLGERVRTPISASFRNSVPLEAAVRFLAESAGLRAELRDHVLFITEGSKKSRK